MYLLESVREKDLRRMMNQKQGDAKQLASTGRPHRGALMTRRGDFKDKVAAKEKKVRLWFS